MAAARPVARGATIPAEWFQVAGRPARASPWSSLSALGRLPTALGDNLRIRAASVNGNGGEITLFSLCRTGRYFLPKEKPQGARPPGPTKSKYVAAWRQVVFTAVNQDL